MQNEVDPKVTTQIPNQAYQNKAKTPHTTKLQIY